MRVLVMVRMRVLGPVSEQHRATTRVLLLLSRWRTYIRLRESPMAGKQARSKQSRMGIKVELESL